MNFDSRFQINKRQYENDFMLPPEKRSRHGRLPHQREDLLK